MGQSDTNCCDTLEILLSVIAPLKFMWCYPPQTSLPQMKSQATSPLAASWSPPLQPQHLWPMHGKWLMEREEDACPKSISAVTIVLGSSPLAGWWKVCTSAGLWSSLNSSALFAWLHPEAFWHLSVMEGGMRTHAWYRKKGCAWGKGSVIAMLSFLWLVVTGKATILDRNSDLRDNFFISPRRVSRGDFDFELGQPPPIETP